MIGRAYVTAVIVAANRVAKIANGIV
jgi:hypothetical protein